MFSRMAATLIVGLMFPLLSSAADDAKTANILTAQEKKDGWKLLFDGQTLDGWRKFKKQDTAGWTIKDGCIVLEKPGSGDLMTIQKYGNFELLVDFKFESGNNSGIVYRCSEDGGTTYTTGPEMQVMAHPASAAKLGKNDGGSLYDMYAPTSNPFKGLQEWTTFKIICNGKHIEHYVNGVKVVECDMGSEEWNTRLAASKWKNVKLFASQPTGHIALQDHGGKLAFRNLKIKVLDK